MQKFDGQTAIVTGATRGIGRAAAESFLELGAKVVAVYSSDEAAAAKLKEDFSSHGDRLETFRLDVSDYSACETFFKQFEEENESLDILVNSAGIRRDGIVGMMSEEDWRRVIDINLTGTFNMSKLAVKVMMKKRYGRIINITSPIGQIGFPGQANYAASKAGQTGFTRALAKEVASRKITVNCVSPGFIDTDFIADLPEAQLDGYKKQVPMKRFGTAEEVAAAIIFLSGGNAGYITGATLEITGGL